MKLFLLTIILFLLSVFYKYIPLEFALQKISLHEYTEEYVCTHFSNDLVKELEKYGIQSEVVIGESPKTSKQDNIKHAWVSVWFEPQSGTFTKNYTK